MKDFFNKAVVIDQISHDPIVQDALMEKAEDLLNKNELETAFGVLIDMYQYTNLRLRYEPTLLAALGYCLTI